MMKKLFIAVSLITLSAYAKEGSFHGGLSYIHQQMTYKEPGVMSEKGKLRGIGVDLLYNFTENLSVNLQGKFLSGHLEYDGATWSGTPLKQTTNDTLREYRALVYYRLGDFAPYTGYGYRYWMNDLVISYRRETTYNYIPLGLRYILRPFYFSYEHREFLGGTNISYMSDTDPARSDAEMEQNSGKGYALEVGLLGEIGSFDVKFSVAYEYWKIDDSEIGYDGVDYLVEPHNSTNSLIFSLGVFY